MRCGSYSTTYCVGVGGCVYVHVHVYYNSATKHAARTFDALSLANALLNVWCISTSLGNHRSVTGDGQRV